MTNDTEWTYSQWSQIPPKNSAFFSFLRVDSSNCRCSFWPFLAQKFQFWGLCSRKILQIKDWGSNRTCPPFLLFFWRLKCLCSCSPTLLAAVLIGDSSTTFWWKLVSCLCHFIHRLLRKTRKKVLHAIAITGHITQWTKISWKCLIFMTTRVFNAMGIILARKIQIVQNGSNFCPLCRSLFFLYLCPV